MSKKRQQLDWQKIVSEQADKWNHVIYKVTGTKPTRRSIVFWSCSEHPNTAPNSFNLEDEMLNNLLLDTGQKLNITAQEVNELISLYPEEQFYASRIDEYTKVYKKTARVECCVVKLFNNRTEEGYKIYQTLLLNRGKHSNTSYVLEISSAEYKGKLVKHPIKCEIHKKTFMYSMKDLTTITSCPCLDCRTDPNHKNSAVEIIKKRNAGRSGQVIHHAQRVKEKYLKKCVLSNSTFELHHHHLDSQEFYLETQLLWNMNGICLCGLVHRDYHFNFLTSHSLIAKEYSIYSFDLTEINLAEDKKDDSNPDLSIEGAEVSRYTLLEYLKFLRFDIKYRDSAYVNELNKKMQNRYEKLSISESENTIGEINLVQIELTIQSFSAEYKGEKWGLAHRKDIPFANDSELWAKVDNVWN
jgi:hypothetical protein